MQRNNGDDQKNKKGWFGGLWGRRKEGEQQPLLGGRRPPKGPDSVAPVTAGREGIDIEEWVRRTTEAEQKFSEMRKAMEDSTPHPTSIPQTGDQEELLKLTALLHVQLSRLAGDDQLNQYVVPGYDTFPVIEWLKNAHEGIFSQAISQEESFAQGISLLPMLRSLVTLDRDQLEQVLQGMNGKGGGWPTNYTSADYAFSVLQAFGRVTERVLADQPSRSMHFGGGSSSA